MWSMNSTMVSLEPGGFERLPRLLLVKPDGTRGDLEFGSQITVAKLTSADVAAEFH